MFLFACCKAQDSNLPTIAPPVVTPLPASLAVAQVVDDVVPENVQGEVVGARQPDAKDNAVDAIARPADDWPVLTRYDSRVFLLTFRTANNYWSSASTTMARTNSPPRPRAQIRKKSHRQESCGHPCLTFLSVLVAIVVDTNNNTFVEIIVGPYNILIF